jgi:hypothetical protein
MATIAKLVVELDSTGMTASLRQTTAGLMDFARAGASAEQITQLTGIKIATAKDAVARFGGQAASSAGEVRGLAAAQREMAVAGVTVNNTATAMTRGMGTLRSSLASTVTAMSGLPPQLTMIVSQLGVMGAGFVPVIAGLAAVGAGIGVWRAWHEEATKAGEEQKKLTEETVKWYEAQKNNGLDAIAKQIDAVTKSMQDLQKQMQSTVGSSVGTVGAGGSKLMAWIRILTAGDPVAIATQFRLEMFKGTAVITKAIETDAAAIVAKHAEANKKIADAFIAGLSAVRALITAEKALSDLRQLDAPIGIELTRRLVTEQSRLVDQLTRIEKINPFGEMATALRAVVVELDATLAAIGKIILQEERLAKILATPIPGIATPVRPGVSTTVTAAPVLDAPRLDVSKLQGVFDVLGGVVSSLGEELAFAFGPVAIIMRALQPALQILADLFDKLLAPLVAVVEVIVQGLVPQFKLLFPIIKLFGEIVAIVDIVVGKVVAAFAQVVGGAIKAIGHFIGQIPFMGGLGKSIENFGDSILGFSNGVKENVSQMEQTLRDLQAMQFGDTAVAVTKLGDAANQVAGVLNGPQGFKYEWTKYMASAAVPLTPPSIGMGGSTKSAEGSTASTSIIVNTLNIDAQHIAAKDIFEMVKTEAQKASLARFGTTTRAAEVLAGA